MYLGSRVFKLLSIVGIIVLLLWNLPSEGFRSVIGYWTQSGECPDQYVLVGTGSYINKSFCVAKYEMKNVSGNALPAAASEPWTGLTRTEAASFCRAHGPGYDLISNYEWQTIARDIATNPANWSGGAVVSGELNRGHSDGSPALPLAAEKDSNPCYGTGQSCTLSSWNSQRRTFRLSSGDVIWDFAGNAAEWILDDNSAAVGADGFISTLNAGDIRQALFGHTAFCASPSASPYCGYGNGIMNAAAGAVIRGGAYANGVNAGIFSVDLSSAPTQAQDEVGFRCVYYPQPKIADTCVGTSTPGVSCRGGAKYAGALSGNDYMVTPGACTNSPTPLCPNTADTLTKAWGANSINHGVAGTTDGQNNTAILDAGWANTAAAKYCAALIYGGYDDWFLPATAELNILYTNRVAIGSFAAAKYWTSTSAANGTAAAQHLSTSTASADPKTTATSYVRCMRKLAPILTAWQPVVFNLDAAHPATSSAWQTVTITNQGQKTSAALTTSVSSGFELGSNGCVGQTLAVGASCALNVRAIDAILDGPFDGTLTVASGTSNVVVPLSGLSSGHPDPCLTATAAGTKCEGGPLYGGTFAYGGGIGTRKLMVTPGGCTDSTSPACAGGTDGTLKAWGTSAAHATTSTSDGLASTVTLDTGWADTAAAKYCANMNYGGYDDWYLPASAELSQLYTNRVALGGFNNTAYWSTTHVTNANANAVNFSNGSVVSTTKTTSARVRCVRRFAGLEINPTVINSVNIVGPATSGSWKVVTVSNTGSTTTSVLSLSITGDLLEINSGTDTCTGQTLASGETCTFDIRAANAVLDRVIDGSATVTAGSLNATVLLKGAVTGVGDPCAGTPPPGTICYGGSIYAGEFGGQSYMVTPGNCTDSATPTCNGSTDTLNKKVGGGLTEHGTTSTTDGIGNTLIQAAFADAAAAKYCSNMVYGGYSDWFLPAKDQLSFLYTNKAAIGGFANEHYWSSTSGANVFFVWFAFYVDFNAGATSSTSNSTDKRVRCMRVGADVVPDPIDWTDFTNVGTSQALSGISMISIEISITATTGSPIAWYRKNGGGWIQVAPGTPVTLSMTTGNSIQFMTGGTNGSTATFTVKNISDSNTILDTAVGTVSGDCGGQWYGGYCWYQSASGQSCTTVCSTHGGYHAATRTFVGDQGTNANCGAVMNGLGSPAGSSASSSSGCKDGAENSGCAFSLSLNNRCTNGATTAGYAGMPRACACNQ